MLAPILNQPNMRKVLYALIPIQLFAVYLFGWRVLLLTVICNVIAYFTEYLFIRSNPKGKVTLAAFVTATLLALTLPPTLPFWIAGVGTFVAICFGKMVFGGFGTNIFNPAIVGRTFIYISFPQQMTISWVKPYLLNQFPGGFISYSPPLDVITSATILAHFRKTGDLLFSFQDTILGFKTGSMGETSAVLIILAALYLITTKTASWKIMVGTAVSILLFNLAFTPNVNPFYLLCSGGALFGIVFMATEPVTLPKDKIAIWIYGLFIGFLTVFIRAKSLFYEGFMFALLLANSFMPIIEYVLQTGKRKQQSQPKAVPTNANGS